LITESSTYSANQCPSFLLLLYSKQKTSTKQTKKPLKTTSAPQSAPDAMPTGHAAIVLCDCSCLFRVDGLQGRNSFVWHIYLL